MHVKAPPKEARSVQLKAYPRRRGVMGVVGDREILEMAEARVLAHNFKTKEWLNMALKVSERIYGKGSGERIKAYMRVIWREEMRK
jgi:hypothetical protein